MARKPKTPRVGCKDGPGSDSGPAPEIHPAPADDAKRANARPRRRAITTVPGQISAVSWSRVEADGFDTFATAPAPANPDESHIGLDDEDEKILRTLAQSPLRLFAIVDLPGSNKATGLRVNAMIARGWARRPKGKNGGVQITSTGLALATQAGLIDRK